jgi:CHAD domain-containing protein
MASSGKWIDGIGPETTVVDAARRSLELRLAVVAHALPLAAHLAEHDIEHVHRLRVATRRAAAALKLYRDWLPRKPARWIKKRLRQIRRAVSEARDLDVLIERLQRELGAAASPMLRFLAEKRSKVQPEITELAEDLRRDDRFVRKAARLLDKIAPPNADDQSMSPIRFCAWAPPQLANFRSAFVEKLPNGSDDVNALHQFRIRGKALRYAIELLAPAFGPQLRNDVYPAVEKLQEKLGTITDHTAAMKLLTEWQSHSADQPARGGPDILEMEKNRQLEDLRDFHQWWTTERADRLQRALADQAAITCSQF